MQAEITDYQTVKKLGSRYLNMCQLANFANDNCTPRQAIPSGRCTTAAGRSAALILISKL